MFPINALIDSITGYLKVKADQIKLEISGHVAKILAGVLTYLIIGLLGLFLLFFLAITLSIYLNILLESQILGYLIVSGLLILKVILLLIFLKTGKFQRSLESLILRNGDDD